MDKNVPYIVFEGEMARHERTIKRLVTLLILTIALLFVSNVAWLWFFNQFNIEGEMYSMDGGMSGYGRSYGDISNRGYYSNDGYYYDGEGNSTRRGRGINGRFVSRDGSDMARQLRDMMADAPDEQTRNDIRKLVEKMESR